MEDVLLEAAGLNGRLMLLRNVVRVQRLGMMSFLRGSARTERDIAISHIKSIRFVKAGFLSRGYMEITATDDDKVPDAAPGSGGECVVAFKASQQRSFEGFRGALEERMGGGPSRAPATAATDLDELAKLASLRDRRIITEDEFNQKKKRLLGL